MSFSIASFIIISILIVIKNKKKVEYRNPLIKTPDSDYMSPPSAGTMKALERSFSGNKVRKTPPPLNL